MRSPSLPLLAALALTIASASCAEQDGPVSPGHIVSSSSIVAATLSTEPVALSPQFLTAPDCRIQPAFVTPLTLSIVSQHILFLNSVRFDFVDQFGGRSAPTAVPVAGPGIRIPTAPPVPIPTMTSIPTSGFVGFSGLLISSGRPLKQAFSLGFGCGISAAGTLFIVVDVTTDRGMADTVRMSVRIGT